MGETLDLTDISVIRTLKQEHRIADAQNRAARGTALRTLASKLGVGDHKNVQVLSKAISSYLQMYENSIYLKILLEYLNVQELEINQAVVYQNMKAKIVGFHINGQLQIEITDPEYRLKDDTKVPSNKLARRRRVNPRDLVPE